MNRRREGESQGQGADEREGGGSFPKCLPTPCVVLMVLPAQRPPRWTSSSGVAPSTTAPGPPGRLADVGIKGDRIARVGDLSAATAPTTVDAAGLAVAPGFINMLSWATESLLVDGRSQGDIRQGVTLEIFGEGSSMGPLNDAMKKRMVEQMGDIKYDITWTTLAEYLQELERRGISHQRRLVHRRDDHPRARDRPRGQEADAGRARGDARAGAAGDGGGRARHRLVAHLRAGVLRVDRGADRAVQGRRAVSAASTSRTCAAKAIACSRRSTS